MSKILTALISALFLAGCYPVQSCSQWGDAFSPWTNYCPPGATYPIYAYDFELATFSLTPWAANFAGPSCVIYTPVGITQNLGGICPPLAAVPCEGVCNFQGKCSISCFAPLRF